MDYKFVQNYDFRPLDMPERAMLCWRRPEGQVTLAIKLKGFTGMSTTMMNMELTNGMGGAARAATAACGFGFGLRGVQSFMVLAMTPIVQDGDGISVPKRRRLTP